jgi:2-polyprenyl-3-methyl-5-hydroxy-6-metoxy-1,4-benzoquinol methylase
LKIKQEKQLRLDDISVNTWDEMVSVYSLRIKQYGVGYKALFYPDESLHLAKLAHISRVCQSEIMPADTVLDVGCGIGDLIPFLPKCNYKGIDLVSQFVDKARSIYPNLSFECVNLVDVNEEFDWLVLAGMMGTVPLPEDLLKKAWEIAVKGVIVDFIDGRKYQGYLNSYNLEKCVAFFIELGAQQIKLYPTPQHNWTVFVVGKQSLWI